MKKLKSSSLKWLFIKSRPFIWRILFLTLCASVVSYVSVRFALCSKNLLDSALIPQQRYLFNKNILSLVILILCQLLLHIVYTVVSLKTEGVIRNRIQSSLFNRILYKKWRSVTEYHSGEMLNRLNGDINVVSGHIMSVVPTLVALLSKIIMSFAALYVLDRNFALIFLVIGPFVMIIARLYSRKIKPISKKCMETQGTLHSFILESLRGLQVIKSFGVEEGITSRAQHLQKDNLSYIMKRGFLNVFANILFFISLTAGYYFAVCWCAWKISNALMTVGTFTAVIQLVGQAQTPFKDLASTIPQIYNMTVSAERIMEIENLPEEEMRYSGMDTKALYEKMESIEIDSISFSYNEENIFDNASVSIPKGSLVAISGLSGIGKSTLIKLIMGIIEPDSGEIKIKTSDESYISDASLRSMFAYVPQGNMILSGTVRENIAFMQKDVNDEQIIASAKDACIWDTICNLPDGLDTVLGENGSGLSEGQTQRLAVARALCSTAPVLLLDEATSALDEDTERQMLENIMNKKNTTCIIISHKECAFRKASARLTVSDKKLKYV